MLQVEEIFIKCHILNQTIVMNDVNIKSCISIKQKSFRKQIYLVF